MQTTPPVVDDFPAIEQLLASNHLPTEDVRNPAIDFLLKKNGNRVVGCGAVETLDGCCLLRSIAVAESSRRQGIASELCRDLLSQAGTKGLGAVYLLTMDAADYFARWGFERVDRERAPNAIKQSSQFSELCPGSAILMRFVGR